MIIEKIEGHSPRLYTLVAPLVMRRSILRQNNNYPFWTSSAHMWFIAQEGEFVRGFVPVELTDKGEAKINNYYIAGDDEELLGHILKEIISNYRRKYVIRSVTHTRHMQVFKSAGFHLIKEWKLYVKMEYGKKKDS